MTPIETPPLFGEPDRPESPTPPPAAAVQWSPFHPAHRVQCMHCVQLVHARRGAGPIDIRTAGAAAPAPTATSCSAPPTATPGMPPTWPPGSYPPRTARAGAEQPDRHLRPVRLHRPDSAGPGNQRTHDPQPTSPPRGPRSPDLSLEPAPDRTSSEPARLPSRSRPCVRSPARSRCDGLRTHRRCPRLRVPRPPPAIPHRRGDAGSTPLATPPQRGPHSSRTATRRPTPSSP
jgi:hypothetical protein